MSDIDKSKIQQRIWCAILYPLDNEEHKIAIEILKDSFPGTILMRHDRDDNKYHYHVIIRSEQGIYKGWLLNKLLMDFDKNEHLFVSLKDIKYKRLDKYLVYLTHHDKPEKAFYSPEKFEGTDRIYAINVVNEIINLPNERFNKVINYLPLYFKDVDNKFKFDTQIYLDLSNKFGSIIYKKWGMLKGFINEYKVM